MAKRNVLLNLDNEDDSNVELKVNKDYANKYSTWREKEELQKLKSKYGDVEEDSESSSSEEEDENAEGWSEQLEKDWLRTLAAVKSGDPRIYQKDFKFYNSDSSKDKEDGSANEMDDPPKIKKRNEKQDETPVYLRDFERKFLLEKGGVLSDSEAEEEDNHQRSPSYMQEQEALKKSIQQAIKEMDDDNDEDCLKPRIKTKAEKAKEEEEYRQWLKGEKSELGQDKQAAVDLAPLKNYWSQPDLDEREKYLRDFILNKAYLNKEEDEDPPTYHELIEELEEDEETLEHQEQFERKYNFRFEEPDSQFLQTHARIIEDSVRRKDNKRALKHQEIKERKKKEKEEKQEEIRQLKNLKKKEILERLEQLKEITGNPDVGFSAKDIEDDFDPAAHDQMMQKYFGDDFYQEQEDVKPEFKDDADEDFDEEDWDNWDVTMSATHEARQHTGEYEEPHVDDPDFIMDADYDPTQVTYTSGKKRKRGSKFAEILQTKKPTFDEVCKKYEGSDHPFGDYIDEYFQLDCEDIIAGDIKCRFRYRKTVPNNYGLSLEEILRCPDRELNSWASLKKICQFRTEEDELYEVKKYKRARQLRKKLTVLPSLRDKSESNVESEGKNKRDEPETSLNIAHESTLKEKRQLDNNSQKSSEQKTDSPSVKKKHKAEKYSFTEKGTGVFVNVGLREQAVTQEGVHKTADALVLTGDSSKKVNSMTATTSKIKDHERTEKSEHKTEKKLHQVAVGKKIKFGEGEEKKGKNSTNGRQCRHGRL
ncbi:hypothetical protein C0Q70_15907 [Pomacea canaliculata]|uniref:Protein KRI1 homolog n=1 Tax=Pomacea canaliculata TaxID=400727 RepID=A0A2T7NNC8_POMCA|nr:hypothetical protein C0Q70_15907 [Pomacea canaliculata]